MFHSNYPPHPWLVPQIVHSQRMPVLLQGGYRDNMSLVMEPFLQRRSFAGGSPYGRHSPGGTKKNFTVPSGSGDGNGDGLQANGYQHSTPVRRHSRESLAESVCSVDSGIGMSRSPTPTASQKGIKRHLEVSKAGQSSRSLSPTSPPEHKRRQVSPSVRTSPVKSLHSKKWDQVSMKIMTFYNDNKQSKAVYEKKMKLRDMLHNVIREIFPYCGLYVVGSSMNGLGTDTSDIDMCLMICHEEVDQKTEALSILTCLHKTLTKFNFVRRLQFINAKVPILKFTDTVSGIEVDLNVNNSVGIRNTQLLNCYSRVDRRVAPLVLIVKRWAQQQDINDAKNVTLSSYSLVLMVLHYLQCGCSPPVIPCLQKIMPDHFQLHSDVRQLRLETALPPFASGNTQSLGELFFGFLKYYSYQFCFEKDCISVRLGCTIPRHQATAFRSPKNSKSQWKFIAIEEPFDHTNTARAVYLRSGFDRITRAFRMSVSLLEQSQNLNSIVTL